MLEVFHGVERILQRFGDILLDILCRGSRIHRYDHYRVCIDIRIKVDREFRKEKRPRMMTVTKQSVVITGLFTAELYRLIFYSL